MRCFLDFEASSLAKDSYPIEVAWVFEDGRAESHLICPLPAWTDWDARAAAIHGISRNELLEQGNSVAELGPHLLEMLGGHLLYASSPSWDGKWLSVLLRGAGLPRHALRLKDTDEAQLEAAMAALAGHIDASLVADAAKAVIDRTRATHASDIIAHRALPDAQHERELWLKIAHEAQCEAFRLVSGRKL